METKVDPVGILILFSLIIVIILMFSAWRELRRLREILHSFLSSSRDNSRAIMAAIHEVGALSERARKLDPPSNKNRSRGEVE